MALGQLGSHGFQMYTVYILPIIRPAKHHNEFGTMLDTLSYFKLSSHNCVGMPDVTPFNHVILQVRERSSPARSRAHVRKVQNQSASTHGEWLRKTWIETKPSPFARDRQGSSRLMFGD